MPKKKKPPTSPTFSGGGTAWHPATSILFNLNPVGFGKKKKKPFKPNGPGIPGHAAGSWVGTGGAIYGTVASNWATKPKPKPPTTNTNPNLNQIKGGVGPYVAPTFAVFKPPTTIWEELYDITTGVGPGGNTQWRAGTPGTLKFGVGTAWDDLGQEYTDKHATEHIHGVYGATGNQKLPSTTLASNRNQKRPAWLSWSNSGALTFDPYTPSASGKAGMFNRWIPDFLKIGYQGLTLSQWTPHVPMQ